MNFELFISRRYIRTALLNTIATIVVSFGVFLFVIILSVMNGFEREVHTRITGHNAHVLVRKYFYKPIANYHEVVDKILTVDGVLGASPIIAEKVGLKTRDAQEFGGLIGLDPTYARQTTKIKEYIKHGNIQLDSMKSNSGKFYPGVIVGVGMANRLGVTLGDEIFLSTFNQDPTDIFSSITPKIKRFVVCAFYESGYNEYDAHFVMIGLKQAQNLYNLGNTVNSIQVRVKEMMDANTYADKVKELLGYEYYVTDWMTINRTLFKWIKLEKLIMFVILGAYILLASLSIVSSFITVVVEKTREIGILTSMGAGRWRIVKIFLWQGLIIGTIGSAVGLVGGLIPCLLQQHYQIIPIPSEIYFIEYVPMFVNIWDLITICVLVNLLCLLAAFYPAYRAGKMTPVEALKHE